MPDIKVSLHNHSLYSDGSLSLSEMVSFASENGFTHYAVTDHSYNGVYPENGCMKPSCYGEYLNEANLLKERYRGRTEIFVSMEMEYLSDIGITGSGTMDNLSKLDFVLGAVHIIGKNGKFMVADSSPEEFMAGVDRVFGGSLRESAECYYATYASMAKTLAPDVYAHFDIIKKNLPAHVVAKPWYRNAALDCLDAVSAQGGVVEVNTGGMYRYGEKMFYPSDFILKRMREKNIYTTFSADAHNTDMLGKYYAFATDRLKAFGYDKIALPYGNDRGFYLSGF